MIFIYIRSPRIYINFEDFGILHNLVVYGAENILIYRVAHN